MPYTDVWSDAIPADSAAANTIGAQLRQLRLDVHERFNSLIGQLVLSTDLADPIMPLISPSLFMPVWEMFSYNQAGSMIPVTTSDGGLDVHQGVEVTGFFQYSIKLPAGCILGNITAYGLVHSGTVEFTTAINHLPVSTSTPGGACALVQIGTHTTLGIGTGFQLDTCTSQSGTTIVAGDLYYGITEILPSAGSSTTFLGVLINYTRPIANQVY